MHNFQLIQLLSSTETVPKYVRVEVSRAFIDKDTQW